MVLLPLELESFEKVLTKCFFIDGSLEYILMYLSCKKTFTVDFLFSFLHTSTKTLYSKGSFVPYPLLFLHMLPTITTPTNLYLLHLVNLADLSGNI